MKNIIFVTGNARKIKEATTTLGQFGIDVSTQEADFDEIQHHDPAEITRAKARAAFAVIDQPVVVQDTSWSIPALGGFPGGYMKDVDAWWQAEDWLQIMGRHEDRSIYCHEHVVYFDGVTLQHFESSYKGVFTEVPKGNFGQSIEKVVCLYHNKTLAEIHDEDGIAPAGEVLGHWRQFGEWFRAQ